MSEKDRIIEVILEIEVAMFLTVNPEPTSSCQEYPESFNLHRRAQFSAGLRDAGKLPRGPPRGPGDR